MLDSTFFGKRNKQFTLCPSQKKIVLVWVPSHCGIYGNAAANIARLNEARLATIVNTIPREDWTRKFFALFKKQANDKWMRTMGKVTEIKRNYAQWTISYRKSRREEVILCRHHLGHCEFSHGYLLRGLEAPTCTYCNVKRTVKHVIYQCEKFFCFFLFGLAFLAILGFSRPKG